jgi:hypothetical protein
LAIKVVKIENPDNLHILADLEQTEKNVKASRSASGGIDSLVIDLSFRHGKVLYEIDLQGLEFVISLKRKMVPFKGSRAQRFKVTILSPDSIV